MLKVRACIVVRDAVPMARALSSEIVYLEPRKCHEASEYLPKSRVVQSDQVLRYFRRPGGHTKQPALRDSSGRGGKGYQGAE
jgi:hypothetical protein